GHSPPNPSVFSGLSDGAGTVTNPAGGSTPPSGAGADRMPARLAIANICTRSRSRSCAGRPVSALGLSTGPNARLVPGPDSNATAFIWYFEYSYDSTPAE